MEGPWCEEPFPEALALRGQPPGDQLRGTSDTLLCPVCPEWTPQGGFTGRKPMAQVLTPLSPLSAGLTDWLWVLAGGQHLHELPGLGPEFGQAQRGGTRLTTGFSWPLRPPVGG